MNLQEQLNRIQEMMGINETTSPSTNIRRRLILIKELLDNTLSSTNPCEFDTFQQFKKNVVLDTMASLMVDEIDGLTPTEVGSFIKEYLVDDIKEHYNNSLEDC